MLLFSALVLVLSSATFLVFLLRHLRSSRRVLQNADMVTKQQSGGSSAIEASSLATPHLKKHLPPVEYFYDGSLYDLELSALASASAHRQRRPQTLSLRRAIGEATPRSTYVCSICREFEHRHAHVVENHALFCFQPSPAAPRGWWKVVQQSE